MKTTSFTIILLALFTNAFASKEIKSKVEFNKITKGYYSLKNGKYQTDNNISKDTFEKKYISDLEKLSLYSFELKRVISRGIYSAYIYTLNGNPITIDCLNLSLTKCLYRKKDSFIFVVKTPTKDLVSIGHNSIIPLETERFGETAVIHEVLILKGKGKGLLKQSLL